MDNAEKGSQERLQERINPRKGAIGTNLSIAVKNVCKRLPTAMLGNHPIKDQNQKISAELHKKENTHKAKQKNNVNALHKALQQ